MGEQSNPSDFLARADEERILADAASAPPAREWHLTAARCWEEISEPMRLTGLSDRGTFDA